MSGGISSDPPLDDWFDEPQPRADSRGQRASAADNWLDGEGETARERHPGRALRGGFRSRRGLIAVGMIAVVLLLIGLAVGGVFSGEGSTSSPQASPTTASTPTTTPTPAAGAPSAAGPATKLKPGATGAQVRALQRALAALGYSPGKIDGSYGPATKTALASFQRASKLSPDGILGAKTLAALRKALRKGG